MGITQLGYFIFYCVVSLTVSFFGSMAGFTVNGVQYGGVSEYSSVVDWVTAGTYFWNLLSFGIDGMPAWVSLIFLGMTAVLFFLLFQWIRGTGS